MVDLGSGSGGAVAYLLERLPVARELQWTLTDMVPLRDDWEVLSRRFPVEGCTEPVDLEALPGWLGGDRGVTLVGVLHELEPPAAARLLRELCHRTAGVLAVEPVTGHPLQYLGLPFLPAAAALAPLLGAPRSPLGWLLSIVVPVLPLVHLHDGWASMRRAHRVRSVSAWLAAGTPPGWSWEVGEAGPWFLWGMAWPEDGP